MESRKVQVTGGSTYTVSLPKEWATENEVEEGSTVTFYHEDNALVLTPGLNEEIVEGVLDVTDLHREELVQAVVTMYVCGFDIISLEGKRITTDQRRSIRSATQSLVSLEVLEETSDRVVVQDLLNSSELSIHDALTRMRRLAITMLEDALTALAENNNDLSQDVIERDDDVDRLWFVISRTFRAALRVPSAAEELGLHREVCFDYHMSARQLERIADHAMKIAQVTLELDKVPNEVLEALNNLHGEADTIINTSIDALFIDDRDQATELANKALQSVHDIDKHTSSIDELLRQLDPHQAQNLGIVVDSLSRSADYGSNIAETALQKAFPQP